MPQLSARVLYRSVLYKNETHEYCHGIMPKTNRAVTARPPRRTKRRREWKATQIAQIVELAQRPVTPENAARLLVQIKRLVRPRSLTHLPVDAGAQDVLSIQRELRAGLAAIASGEGWVLPPVERVIDNRGSYLSGPLATVFLHQCADLLAGEQCIARCAGAPDEPCQAVILRRKGGKYCRVHGSAAVRGRRSRKAQRDRLTPEELRRRHHQEYKQRVAREKGQSAARKVRERRKVFDAGMLAALAAEAAVALRSPEPVQAIVVAAPSPAADFETWLAYQLEENSAALKRTMARVLSTREEDILRAAHGIRCDRASLSEIVKARRKLGLKDENRKTVEKTLRGAESKLRAAYEAVAPYTAGTPTL